MIRKIDGKWHAYSESGRHFGGPYSTEAEAKHRIAQMEYFKHHKVAGLLSPEALVGALPSMIMTPQLTELALRARINRGKGLIGKENEIAKRVKKDPTMEGDAPIARALTHPATLAGATFGVAAGAPHFITANRRAGLQAARRQYERGQAAVRAGKATSKDLGEMANVLNKWINPPLVEQVGLDVRRPVVNELKKLPYKSWKSILPVAAMSAAITGAYIPWRRHQLADHMLKSEENSTNSFIRTKLREGFAKEGGIPVAAIDDVVMLAARAAQAVKPEEEAKKLLETKQKSKPDVKKELAAIEKKA